MERTKNAARNIIIGLALKVYQMIVPFLMRSAIIYFLGAKYLGLNSLFTSILQVLNLAELGVASAMVYSMYQPIVEDDKKKICGLLGLYRKYYRIIGFVILAGGILLAPFLPYLISDHAQVQVNIYVLYFISLATTVISYWLYAYKGSILLAHQRMDVPSRVTILTDTCKYILQLVVLAVFQNYYGYVIITLLAQVMDNLLVASQADRHYPEYQPEGTLPKEEKAKINQRIRDLFTNKLGMVIVESADSIVISAFLGLTMLAVYQNYFCILASVAAFVKVLFMACTAGIGNSLILESKEKNYNDLKNLTFLTGWIAGFCTVCLLCLYQPFMECWVGKDLMLNFSAVICFSIYFFVYEFQQMLEVFKDAAGIWHKDRFRPLTTALANLGLNLILVQYIGIYGVLLSTVVTVLGIGMPWLIYNLFTEIYHRNPCPYIGRLCYYILTTMLAYGVARYLCQKVSLDGVLGLLIKAVICTVAANGVLLLCYFRLKEFGQMRALLRRALVRMDVEG